MSITASPARTRLLETATRLFYAEGIQAIGVDRLVTEAKVTRATFYRQFPGKDELVRAYLDQQDRVVRHRLDQLAATAGPHELVKALTAWLVELACTPGTRGCTFINAAAEYPDPDHPVRQVIATHRRWLRDLLAGVLAEIGHPEPERAATTFMLLHDGAMVGGYLDDPADVRAALEAAVTALVRQPQPEPALLRQPQPEPASLRPPRL